MKAIIHSIIPNGQYPGAVVSVWDEKRYVGTFVEPVVFSDAIESAETIKTTIYTAVIEGIKKDTGLTLQPEEIKMLNQIFLEAETSPLNEQIKQLTPVEKLIDPVLPQ